MNKIIFLILLSLILGSFAQLSLKLGINDFGKVNGTNIIFAIFQPFVFLGLVIYFLSSITWLIALSKSDVSYAYPFISLSYVIVAFLGWIFLNEKIDILRILGISIIIFGVYLIGKSK